MRKLLLIALVGAIVVMMLAAGALIVSNPTSTRGAEHLDYGQAIQIDDFAFSAVSSERATQIGDQQPQGVFYIVPFKVMNRAQVVPFRFKPEVARLIDNAGVEHTPSLQAGAQWFAVNGQSDGCVQQLAAGTECSTVLVFDVPADTQAPVLKIKFGEGLLEVADALAYGNRVIQLH
jgi:Domain of unknown function (DUF4352)